MAGKKGIENYAQRGAGTGRIKGWQREWVYPPPIVHKKIPAGKGVRPED